jgi:hypothetical protein
MERNEPRNRYIKTDSEIQSKEETSRERQRESEM